jgi:hypothetical protein
MAWHLVKQGDNFTFYLYVRPVIGSKNPPTFLKQVLGPFKIPGRLRVFENTVLRRIFGPKREEDGSWRKLHDEEFHNLYSSSNIVRVIKSRMRWAKHVARMGEGRGVYRVLIGRPEGKRPLGRPWRRWEDNIKMDFREIRIDGAKLIQLAQDRIQWRAFVSTVVNLRVPYGKHAVVRKLSN